MSNRPTQRLCFTCTLMSFLPVLFLTSISFSSDIARTSEHYYIYVQNVREGNRDRIRSQVAQLGGQLRHTLSDSEFVAVLPLNVAKNLHSDVSRSVFIESFTGARIFADSSMISVAINLRKPTTAGARAWDIFKSGKNLGGVSSSISSSENVNLFERQASTSILADESGPFKNPITSLYLMGEVAVALVLMESSGSEFNWTSEQEDTALARLMIDLDSLSLVAFESGIGLSWVYEVDKGVPTSSEPINETAPSGGDLGWIGDALSFLGFPSGYNGARQFAASLRSVHKTDWALSVFVALNEPGSLAFPNGLRTFVPVEGQESIAPFIVSTSGSLGHRKTHHEVSHVFGAMDERGGSGACQATSSVCNNLFGYLRYPNGNCFVCANPQENCVMNYSIVTREYCSYSKGQVGWVDSDGDGAPDPIDPNSGVWMSLFPVQPGNKVTITTINGAMVATFNITERTFDDKIGNGFAIWDGQNFANQPVALGSYIYIVEGNPPKNGVLSYSDLSIKPLPNSAGFWSDDVLRFKLDNSLAYVTIDLFDSIGVLFSRPIWSKLMGSSSTVVRTVDLSLIPNGQYTAKFTAWKSAGGLSDPYSIQFIQYRCGDVNNDGNFNIADVTHLIAHIFSALPIDDPIERADADGSGSVNVTDVNYMVTRIFQGGPAPICSGVQQ